MSPLVSVLTPAYNTAAYVSRAVGSALLQTCSDLEVIAVDDGSTDDTLAVLLRLAAEDPRVRVFSQPNGGVARARNRAFEQARGRYIALLDSDDEWFPEYLQHQLGTLRAHPELDVVTANAINRGLTFDGKLYWPDARGLRRLSLADMVADVDSVCIMSVFRRELHEAIGGYDEDFVGGSEDYDYWLRAATAGFRFVQSGRPLAYYQRRADSMSARPLSMLAGISASLSKLRAASPDDRVHEAIDLQLAAFDCERLSVEARLALRQKDFMKAAECFRSLHERRGGARLALLAVWSRYAPGSLLRVDTLRQRLRRA